MNPLLEKIRTRCIEANPDGLYSVWVCTECHRIYEKAQEESVCEECPDGYLELKERPIRLADVLLAMERFAPNVMLIHTSGTFYVSNHRQESAWNLSTDDLEAQSPETIEFIGKVLGV